jgi:hypothetical protein
MEPGKMSLEADGGNLTAFGNAIPRRGQPLTIANRDNQ